MVWEEYIGVAGMDSSRMLRLVAQPVAIAQVRDRGFAQQLRGCAVDAVVYGCRMSGM